METQREIEDVLGAAAKQAASELDALVGALELLFLEQPQIQDSIRVSEIAFEEYRRSQLALISAGTVAPALENATFALLTRQRVEALKAFVRDIKPDSPLAF